MKHNNFFLSIGIGLVLIGLFFAVVSYEQSFTIKVNGEYVEVEDWEDTANHFNNQNESEPNPLIGGSDSEAVFVNKDIVVHLDTVYVECWWDHKPYDNASEFVDYWRYAAIKFEKKHGVPYELILAKLWLETRGGKAGAGKKGALFGIKGKGYKAYDNVDKEQVEYHISGERWEAFSHFCNTVKKPLYWNRYLRWKKYKPNNPDWYNYALALQVDYKLSNSRLSYAACGCDNGSKRSCYNIRKKHATKTINFIQKYIH